MTKFSVETWLFLHALTMPAQRVVGVTKPRVRGYNAAAATGGISESGMPVIVQVVVLLILSNLFMTFAWYGHLRTLIGAPWYVAALASWSIALCEYLLQVPANRIGISAYSVAQLKILQEVISLGIFVPFAVLYLQQPVKLDYLWAGLCLLGAVYFMFRG